MSDIELVIKIDEETFNNLPNAELGSNVVIDVLDAVEEGIQLPKGHGKLIDADKLNEQFGEVMDTVMRSPKFTKDVEYILRTTATVKSQLKEADTIIEADKE